MGVGCLKYLSEKTSAGGCRIAKLATSGFSLYKVLLYHNNKSLLVHSSCMLILCLCSVMVASQQEADTRQMLHKYMIL